MKSGFLGWVFLSLAACSVVEESDGAGCVAELVADCRPLHDPPHYDVIFEKILMPSCAQGMGTCHSADAGMGGLAFEEPDAAYEQLLGIAGARARVVPGNAACSPLMVRLEARDPAFRMPPGPLPLLESERCDILLWISRGAVR